MSSDKKVRVQVSGPVESEKSIGVLVDLHIDERGLCTSASRLEWFPKSLCELEKIENEGFLPSYFITAPTWIMDKNKVKYIKA